MIDPCEDLLRVAREWLAAGWQKPDRDVFRAIHSADFVDHSPAGRSPDRDGFWQATVAWFAAFPDLVVTADDLIPAPTRGMVTVRWSAVGTHRGAYFGVGPTGRRVDFRGIEILRIDGGLVRERWGEWNGEEIAERLRGPMLS